MIFLAKKTKDKITIANPTAYKKYIAILPNDCLLEITIKKREKKRTSQQNSALHKYFGLLSDALNEKGFGMNKIISGNIEMWWTPLLTKECFWKPIQKAMFGKDSTTKLNKNKEIDMIVDVITKTITEKTGGEVYVPFPSIDNLDR